MKLIKKIWPTVSDIKSRPTKEGIFHSISWWQAPWKQPILGNCCLWHRKRRSNKRSTSTTKKSKNKQFFKRATMPDKIFGTKWSNPVKLDRKRKVWYLFLRVFQLLFAKSKFLKEDEALSYVSTKFKDFPNISKFRKILSLKSFDNSWGSSYTKFATLDIKFPFTGGESDLC